jgi:hypothetical protein
MIFCKSQCPFESGLNPQRVIVIILFEPLECNNRFLAVALSRDLIVLEMDFIVFADFALAEDLSSSPSSAAFL